MSHSDDLFRIAVNLDDKEREVFLNALSDAQQIEIQSLLAADASAERQEGEFLNPLVVPLDTVTSDAVDEIPKQIGPYKILQPIGKGGMGQVYMAEQQEPVKRRVALKVIKTDTPTKAILARFEAERQALAMMNHQNIAKVLDAGTTEDGRPFFAMELVQGVSITEYCDRNKLDPEQRLNLFVQTCRAIQHAHQKGIIHRDLKPGNVLVTLYDGTPVAKVIDFGLAKALQDTTQLTKRTLFTQFGQVVGTLAYMSPEQAEMNALNVDTRTDVYSLGVLLYELLTGSTPIGRERIHSEAFDLILRRIREEDIQRPSVRLSGSGEAITGISEQRNIEPKKLSLLLKGDLDWITVKALEKDRTRRYDGPGAFADDVERFLADQPIVARPPSAFYLARKFVRRNRSLVALTSFAAASLLIAVVGCSFLTLQLSKRNEDLQAEVENSRQLAIAAEEARSEATKRAKEAEAAKIRAEEANVAAKSALELAESERQRAESERTVALAVRDVQSKIFRQTDVFYQAKSPRSLKASGDLTVRVALDRAAAEYTPGKIASRFPDQPAVQAEVLQAIAESFDALADSRRAVEFFSGAIGILEADTSMPNPPQLLKARVDYIFILINATRWMDATDQYAKLLDGVESSLSLSESDFEDCSDVSPEIDARIHAVVSAMNRRLDPENFTMNAFAPKDDLSPGEYLNLVRNLLTVVPQLPRIRQQLIRRYGPAAPSSMYASLATAFQSHAFAVVKRVLRSQNNSWNFLEQNGARFLAKCISDDLASFEKALAVYGQLVEHCSNGTERIDRLRFVGLRILQSATLSEIGGEQETLRSLKHLREARNVLSEVLVATHPAFLSLDISIAAVLRRLGRLPEYVSLQTRIAEDTKRIYGHGHFRDVNSRLELGEQCFVLARQSNSVTERDLYFQRSVRYLPSAVSEAVKLKLPYDYRYLHHIIGMSFFENQKYEDALAAFKAAVKVKVRNEPVEQAANRRAATIVCHSKLQHAELYNDLRSQLAAGLENTELVREESQLAQLFLDYRLDEETTWKGLTENQLRYLLNLSAPSSAVESHRIYVEDKKLLFDIELSAGSAAESVTHVGMDDEQFNKRQGDVVSNGFKLKSHSSAKFKNETLHIATWQK